MDESKRRTIQTYQDKATELAAYFDTVGLREPDIARAFSFISSKNPRVVEIGCGNGRDAAIILKYTKNYLGFDISEGMIKLARKSNPSGSFIVADVENYDFEKNIDIVFTFASLLHSPRESVKTIFERIYSALNPGGIVAILLKQAPYEAIPKEDAFGWRMFYYYEPKDILELAGDSFTQVSLEQQPSGNTSWFSMILRKR